MSEYDYAFLAAIGLTFIAAPLLAIAADKLGKWLDA